MAENIITASIVTYKIGKEELSIVLRCLIDSVIEKMYIIDNYPTDELRSFESFLPKIEYIFGHGNVGYGAAHNIVVNKLTDDLNQSIN